ncbi:MAG: hypothetical protein ACOY94_09165 [Bacillota bacterium]
MTAPQESLESVAERARRALRDNEEARLQAQQALRETQPQTPPLLQAGPQAQTEAVPQAPVHLGHEATPGTMELLERRMWAIQLVRELEPQRACFRQRVQELSRRLAQTPTDSVHYAQLLQRLAEAHTELSRLEGQVEEAQHVIRSTEWLMELLSDPTRTWARQAGQERDHIAR